MPKILKINQNNLNKIKERVSVPSFDRKQLTSSIVHIGVGGFHRAHQAYYLQRYMEQTQDFRWGLCGIGLREADEDMGDALSKQDCLYTLLVRNPDGKNEATLIGSILNYKLGTKDQNTVIAKMADADTKIITLTITEGGYNFNSSTGEFNFENPAIKHELENPKNPKTIYGYLVEAFRKRRDADLDGVTLLSCDNIEHNGDMARKMLLTFCKEQDPDLVKWIEENIDFPNSMVDRITPSTTEEDIEFIKEEYGLEDKWPVTCEPFVQWVIEDKFSYGRPELEKVDVQFVPNVKPYEKVKLRLLNAGHSVLGILGALHGHPTIYACATDNLFKDYFRAFLDNEATPVLDKVEGMNFTNYKDKLEERFANPNIKDSVVRICAESSAKLPKFLISTIKDNLENEGDIKLSTLIIAAWCYYSDKKTNRNGEAIEVIDELENQLHEAASKTGNDTLAFIKQKDIFANLADSETFTKVYKDLVQQVYAKEGDVAGIMENLMGK